MIKLGLDKNRLLFLADAFIIFVIALIVRLIHLKYWNASLYSFPICDEFEFHLFAKNFFNPAISKGVFSKGPFLTVFIGSFYEFLGAFPHKIRLFNVVLGAINCFLAFVISRQFLNKSLSFITGILLVFWTPLIFYDCQILRPVWLTFFSLLFWLAILRSEGLKNIRWLGLAGFFMGLLIITKATGLLLLLLVFIYFLFVNLHKRHAIFLAFFIGVVIPIIPVTLYNLYHGQDLVLISANGGINFYAGNNEEADGTTPIKVGIEWERVKRQEIHWLPALSSERSFKWYKEGFKFIFKNPQKYLILVLKKLLYFLGPIELPNNRNFYFCQQISNCLKIPFAGFTVVFVLGFWGIIRFLGEKLSANTSFLLVLWISIINLSFFTCSRYRLPAVFFLMPFAVWAMADLKNMLKKVLSWNARIKVILIICFIGLPSLSSYFFEFSNYSRDHFFLGNIAYRNNSLRKALYHFSRSSLLELKDPDPVFMAGACFERQGNLQAAKKLYAKAIKLAPDYLEAIQNLASILIRENQNFKAKVLLERAEALGPGNYFTYFNLGVVFEKIGKIEEAERQYNKALTRAGRRPDILNNLSLLWIKSGRNIDQGIANLREIRDSNPDNVIYNNSLGLGYYLKGDFANAYKYFKHAVALEPSNKKYLAQFQQTKIKLYGNGSFNMDNASDK